MESIRKIQILIKGLQNKTYTLEVPTDNILKDICESLRESLVIPEINRLYLFSDENCTESSIIEDSQTILKAGLVDDQKIYGEILPVDSYRKITIEFPEKKKNIVMCINKNLKISELAEGTAQTWGLGEGSKIFLFKILYLDDNLKPDYKKSHPLEEDKTIAECGVQNNGKLTGIATMKQIYVTLEERTNSRVISANFESYQTISNVCDFYKKKTNMIDADELGKVDPMGIQLSFEQSEEAIENNKQLIELDENKSGRLKFLVHMNRIAG